MYEVGLGDSPMSIAGHLSGNPGRYGELLAANPHKPLVRGRSGHLTFAELGVGERLKVPTGFVGDALSDAFGVGSREQAHTRMMQTFGTGDPERAFGFLADAFGTEDEPCTPGLEFGGLGEVGLSGGLFDGIAHSVSRAVHDLGRAAGHSLPTISRIAGGALRSTERSVSAAARLVAHSGGNVGHFLRERAKAFGRDPLGQLMRVAIHGPLGLLGIKPEDLLRHLGIPTPADLLHKIGLPSPADLLHKVGIPSDPVDLCKFVVDPKNLLEKIPGIKEIAKYLPSAPDPFKLTQEVVSAVASGNLNRMRMVLASIGQTVADVVSMVPGWGTAFGGALEAAIELIASGDPLKAGLEFLLGEIPGIPSDIREVFLRPAIDGVVNVVEHHESITDALINSIKEGIVNEAHSRGLPDSLIRIVSDFADSMVQVILRHKPLKQAMVGFAVKGLEDAAGAAVKNVQLPAGLADQINHVEGTLASAKHNLIGSLQHAIPAHLSDQISSLRGRLDRERHGLIDHYAHLLPAHLTAQLGDLRTQLASQRDSLIQQYGHVLPGNVMGRVNQLRDQAQGLEAEAARQFADKAIPADLRAKIDQAKNALSAAQQDALAQLPRLAAGVVPPGALDSVHQLEGAYEAAQAGAINQLHGVVPHQAIAAVHMVQQAFSSAQNDALKELGTLVPPDARAQVDGLEQQAKDLQTHAAQYLPPTFAPQYDSLKRAYGDMTGIGHKTNQIYALTQGLIHLHRKDPKKLDHAVQHQIATIQTSIAALQASMVEQAQAIHANVGLIPKAPIASAPVGPGVPPPPAPPPPPSLPALVAQAAQVAQSAPPGAAPAAAVAAAAALQAATAPSAAVIAAVAPFVPHVPEGIGIDGSSCGPCWGPSLLGQLSSCPSAFAYLGQPAVPVPGGYPAYPSAAAAPGTVSEPPPPCTLWGPPVAMDERLAQVARMLVTARGGQSTVATGPDGVLYRFDRVAGGGVTARPCRGLS